MGLKSLRLEKGWSQEQLAAISGLSDRTIQRAERGETPSLETVRALAASFDLSPAQLRELIETPEEPATMATPETSTPPVPSIPAAWQRVILAAAASIAVLTGLALMQAFAGWDPELLPVAGLIGAGITATLIFLAMGRAKGDDGGE